MSKCKLAEINYNVAEWLEDLTDLLLHKGC